MLLPDDSNPSIFNLGEKLTSLNSYILDKSNSQFDLGNFIDTNFNITTGNMSGLTNLNIIPQAKGYIDDELQTKIVSVLTLFRNNAVVPQTELTELFQTIIADKILYIGSECKTEGFIDVENEFSDLANILKSEFITFSKVESPTIKNIMLAWEKTKPSIVFISCHGLPASLLLQDEEGRCKEFNNDDFVRFFKVRSLYTKCVILSACDSLNLGKLLIETCKNVICINRKVDINTARLFCHVFMEYLNDHSTTNPDVFEDAFKFSKDYVKFEGLQDAFAFEYFQADLKGN